MCLLCNPTSYLAALNHVNAWFQGTWIGHLCWWAFIHPHELNLKEAKGQVDVQNPLIHTYAACCTYLLSMIIHLYLIVYHPYLKHRLYIIDWKPPVIMIFPLQRGDAMVESCWASARGTAVWEAAVGAQHIFRGADVRQFELLIWEDFLMEGERHARIKQCRQPSIYIYIYIYIINKMMASIPAIAMVELRMVEPF